MNLQTDRQLVDLQQWRLSGIFRTMQRDVVKMSGQGGEVEVQAADGGGSARGLIRRFRDLTQGELVERCLLYTSRCV